MKKYSLLFLLLCFLCSCSDNKTAMPRLEIAGISLNGGNENYLRNLQDILPLRSGDYIDVSFYLYGKGADLKTFMVKNEHDNIKSLLFFYPEEVSDEFSDISKGIIGYNDGVRNTEITVKLTVDSPKDEEVRISFYLNSKAPDGEGAVYYLDLETTKEPREMEETEE